MIALKRQRPSTILHADEQPIHRISDTRPVTSHEQIILASNLTFAGDSPFKSGYTHNI